MAESYPGNPTPPNVIVMGDIVPGDKNVYLNGHYGDGPAGTYRQETGGDSVPGGKIIDGAGLIVNNEDSDSADLPGPHEAAQPSPGVGFEIVRRPPDKLSGGGHPDTESLGRFPGGLDIVAGPGAGSEQTGGRTSSTNLRTRRDIANAAMRNLGL